jgi:hypothetical protein
MTRSSRFRFASLTILSFMLAVVPGQSSALGLGAYFEFLHGEGEVDFLGFDDRDFDSDKFGFGFALDTNLAQNRLFNYRLTIGYQRTDRDLDDFDLIGPFADLDNLDGDGFSFNNAFGFGLWRGPRHRLWAGPAIRLGVDVFDVDTNLINTDVDIVDFSVGGGPVIGLYLHAGQNVTVGLTAGYQYLYVAEIVDVDTGGFHDTDAFDGHEHLVSVNVTVFFRTAPDQFD